MDRIDNFDVPKEFTTDPQRFVPFTIPRVELTREYEPDAAPPASGGYGEVLLFRDFEGPSRERAEVEPVVARFVGSAAVPGEPDEAGASFWWGEMPEPAPAAGGGGDDGSDRPPLPPGGDALPDPHEQDPNDGRIDRQQLWGDDEARNALWGPITNNRGDVYPAHIPAFLLPPTTDSAPPVIFNVLSGLSTDHNPEVQSRAGEGEPQHVEPLQEDTIEVQTFTPSFTPYPDQGPYELPQRVRGEAWSQLTGEPLENFEEQPAVSVDGRTLDAVRNWLKR